MKRGKNPKPICKGEKEISEIQIDHKKIRKELERLRNDDSLPLPDPQRKEAVRKYLVEKCRQMEWEQENAVQNKRSFRFSRRFWKTFCIAAVIASCLSITVWAYYRDFILTDYGTHTDVNVYTDEEDINERVLTYYYKPNYIPEGFQLADESFYSFDVFFTYLTKDNKYLTVAMWTVNNGAINTEDMNILPQENINGFKCTLYSQKNESTACIIIDHIDCFVYIYGDLPPDEIVKIAENLEPVPMPDIGDGYSNRYF